MKFPTQNSLNFLEILNLRNFFTAYQKECSTANEKSSTAVIDDRQPIEEHGIPVRSNSKKSKENAVPTDANEV